ncbi:MAG: prepilin-type N-terminal cleavage/methylation domain-containing protein [Deltaproteobacteria bacterium]|nr:prepilin-type N-terminal cleavage/methylation domain-containing protein [Deltaproteobacteria bacterium]
MTMLKSTGRSLGFSLLEVMVALAILSVGLVTLVQVQARSAELAILGREMTVATMLARAKLYDCQVDLAKKGFSVGDYESEGNFDDEGHPTFFWECHAYKPEMPVGEGGDLSSLMGGGDDAAAGGAPNPAGEMGMSFLGPVLTQMSTVMGDSIRELVVIVRWGTGVDQQEMIVTTHVIDKGPVNGVAAMIAQQSRALGAATGTTPTTPTGADGAAAKSCRTDGECSGPGERCISRRCRVPKG